MRHLLAAVLTLGTIGFMTSITYGDEGMWLFNNAPRAQLKELYDFDVTDEWLAHLQRASIRFNNGGSGSFVSSDGLIMTNHHVGVDAIAKLSTAEHNYVEDGFHARTHADELKCHDLELNVLVSIEDVTDRVKSAVTPDMKAADAQSARQAVMNTIEKESLDATGLRSDVVTLYSGGAYHLYRYKKYTDVRLVFAPEKKIAFFGGDPDNFEYPRYDLDVAFFRAYEDDQPAKIEHFLRWSEAGAGDGELVFVSGHPGRTDRQNTVAHLEFIRDRQLPISLNMIRRREVNLRNFSDKSQENARQAEDELFGYQNARKARLGQLAGLQDPAFLQRLKDREQKLRAAIAADPKLRAQTGDAWEQVQASVDHLARQYTELTLIEQSQAFNTELYSIARTLVRLADEGQKPNEKRLREFRESNLESLKQQLFSTAPIYENLEIAKLTDSLSMLVERMGAGNPLVQKILAGQSPADRAAELVRGTALKDVDLRKQLAEGGKEALAAQNDKMIALAQMVDPSAREIRAAYEEKVEEPLRQAYAKIADARFAIEGTNTYPDATFTLRLAFGTVKGYEDQGEQIPPWTNIGGTFEHAEQHGNQYPFELPKSWLDKHDQLNVDAPFNFVNTADIIGGNSGSPIVNRKGEVVGIIFDGNIYSLVLAYAYTDDKARAVGVHSAGITEALKTVYKADELLKELGR